MSQIPACPLCGPEAAWDRLDKRFKCAGIVQHSHMKEGNGPERALVLVASGSGKDCGLFETFPWPEQGGAT